MTGGTWSSGATSVATVDPTAGIVTGVAGGTAVITFTNMCGSATYTVTVHSTTAVQNIADNAGFSISPNPNRGSIAVTAELADKTVKEIIIEIMDMTGRRMCSGTLPAEGGTITLGNEIANGLYIVKLKAGNMNKTMKFTLDR